MTACVNKHTKRVAAVVTASLVGALSLGAAPVAAMAAGGVETQSVTATDALQGGKLTGAVDIDNNEIDIPATGEITFTADGKPQGVVPTEITMGAGVATEAIDLNDFEYTLTYYTANSAFAKGYPTYDGTAMKGSAPVAAGKYVVEMTLTSGNYKGAVITVPFEIKAASLAGLTAVDSVDGSFEYDGTDQLPNIDYKIGDKIIDSDLFVVAGLKYGYKKGNAYSWETVSTIENAGEYSLVLKGKSGTIYAGSETEVKVTIDKLDLFDAVIVAKDDTIGNMTKPPLAGSGYDPAIVSINGKWNKALESAVVTSFQSGPDNSNLIKNTGVYTYTMSPVSGNTNVENTGTFTFVATDAITSGFKYKDGNFADQNVNLSDGQTFAYQTIQVFDAKGELLDKAGYTVTATNTLTGEVTSDLSKVNTPGVWVVNAQINAKDNGYTLGGSASMTVTTVAGDVNTAANLWFSYDNKIVSGSVSVEYDGSDKLSGLKVAVTDSYGNLLTEGDDYKVVVKDKAGNVVNEAVDAGEYVISVESDSYTIDASSDLNGGAQLTLKVAPVAVQAVRIAGDNFTVYENQAFLAYTGSAIVPTIEYQNSDGDWAALPSELYTLSYKYSKDYSTTASEYKKVDEMSANGYYLVYLHVNRDEDTNWDLNANADAGKGFWTVGNEYDPDHSIVRVSDAQVYSDVENTYWAADNIYKATKLGYMNGYNGTTFFGPLDNIKRGDVAVVLYKMAGSPVPTWLKEDYKDANGGYVTGFQDVDSSMYYAQAIAWAKGVGIVSGDTGTGLFRPEDTVSRQELAKMLCVYAEKTGKDTDVDADKVLSAYDDADTVADWAKGYVAWCVEADLMGQDSPLRGTDPINRAEVATMAIRLQPKKIGDAENLIPVTRS